MVIYVVLFVIFMVFAACGYGYWGRTPSWGMGPFMGLFLWLAVLILGLIMFGAIGGPVNTVSVIR